MSSSATASLTRESPGERLDELFEELAELTGQRNAIDGRIVQIVAEIDHGELCGMTGAQSVAALVAWKAGVSSKNAKTIATVAHRLAEFPRCAAGMREGRLSLDQVGVIAGRAGRGSDEHYAQLAESATVSQLRTAIKLEPPPEPDVEPEADPGVEPEPVAEPEPRPEPPRSITRADAEDHTSWHICLPHDEAAVFDAALQSHRDALIAQWTQDHPDAQITDPAPAGGRPPMPGTVDAFVNLIQAGWDSDVAARPHGQRTTVVVHVDIEQRIAALHLGPLLPDDQRRFLTCDATCEVWFQRDGQPIGTGRSTRTIGRRLRRALEYRDRGTCVVPGCGATLGLHAHHIWHWEDGGPTELANLVLLCPHHHRMHHRGGITITGPAHRPVVTDGFGRPMRPGSLARPPTTPPPDVPPCPGPTGERAQWWWYQPFQPPPQPPPAN